MAKSSGLGGQTTKLSSNVKAGEVSVNEGKLDIYYNDMLSQYDKIANSLATLSTLSSNAIKKRTVKGRFVKQLTDLKKKCSNQSKYSKDRKNELKNAYKNDCKDDVIRRLLERVDSLEKTVAKITGDK